MITQRIKLNLIPGGILPRIKASQYDAGARTLVFSLFNGSQAFTIPSGSKVSIRGTKSDHTGFQYECTYSGNEVTAQITDQMTVSPGEVLAELVITKGNDRIATGNFIFDNEEAALKEDVIISHTDIPAIEHLDDIVDLVEEDAAKASAAKTAAETAATQASQSAQAASTSASQASTSATNAASSASAAATSESNAATSETNAGASATQASSSAAAALASQQAAAQSETNAAESESNAETSETNAGNSASAAAASAAAAAASEANASDSETAAAGSATSASTSASQAAGSATNAASSESNAATSETNAGNSATQAASSAQTASTAATNASAAETNAENSAALARKWAVGDSGSGTYTPSDTNNAYYWAQVAQRAAGGGLAIEVVAALPTTDISVSKIYLVPSSDPESQNVKDEYVNLDGTTSGWELIGSTKIDLSGYYTKAQVDALIQDVKDYADGKVAELKTYVQETFAPTTLLKDTVGWTGKNLLPYPYVETTQTGGGITWTDNGDGTVTANGTATAESSFNNSAVWNINKMTLFPKGDYICSMETSANMPDNYDLQFAIRNTSGVNTWETADNGEVTISLDGVTQYLGFRIVIKSGTTVSNFTFKPMVRLADIADDTWEPYHESVEEVVESKLDEDYANVYGAKNLIPYPYTHQYMQEGSHVLYGINYEVKDNSITYLSGTSTTGFIQRIINNEDVANYPKNLILSGFSSGNTSMSLRIRFFIADGTTPAGDTIEKYFGESLSFEISVTVPDHAKYLSLYTFVPKEYTISNPVTIKTMLRLASIKDDTWVPYAKTNKQLTEETAAIEDKIKTVKASYDEDTALYAHAVGDIVYVNEHFYKVTAAIAVGDTIDTGTNITADTGLAVDTPIYVSNLPNS